jgi:hypothetical protein
MWLLPLPAVSVTTGPPSLLGAAGDGVGSSSASGPSKYSRCELVEKAIRAIQVFARRLIAPASKPVKRW